MNWVGKLDAIPAYQAFAAILVTFAAYLVLAAYDMTAFRYIARRVSFLRVAFVSSIAYAFSHNLGFGALTGGAVPLPLLHGLGGYRRSTLRVSWSTPGSSTTCARCRSAGC